MSRAVPYLSLPGITPATVAESTTAADIATAVWASAIRTLTQSAASVAAAVEGDQVSVYRGTSWTVSLTGLGDISAYDTIYFSVKENTYSVSDDDAILRVKNDANGLERIQKEAPTAASNGTVTVDNAGDGNITITVDEVETAKVIPKSDYYYDVKGLDADTGTVDLLSIGERKFAVIGDVTRAVT